ncbi:MAG: radical SAM protein [Desulfobulbus sp.]|jgi:radical SAM superfamily enzyme YgiQ (UPF0313 family)
MENQDIAIRPPSEAFSILLQVTRGCSHNACAFCGAYRGTPFQPVPWSRIEEVLAFAARWCRRQNTLFLADGDALSLSHDTMLTLLERIRRDLPWVRRVSSYASCHNILARTDAQLAQYRSLGLKRLYMGLESGHDPVLVAMAKGVNSAAMVEAGLRARQAGMFVSVSCVLGLGGVTQWREHALATARALERMQPHQIALLSLMLLPNTPLYRRTREGRFVPQDTMGLLRELRELLGALGPIRTQLHANHPSNHLPLVGRWPRDRDALLATIDSALNGALPLQPESCRAL